mmetsp:Transcript_37625/g.83767  ORF Transcript_37625/g.83767 Transcript_37625/m.83767 type:complete len:124 (-) Transcript_37625:932-1303(-)|eukprot:CAMPEP_0202915530 /NCGR_PEP_ID=MMETSP1392-20130828/65908_1 /ASSEMBLY_ACC=CAM_ASM_000868 /TAXON_ID=225041 /ORGANISM="Chlamydomonas chlamydogama, Strain SAG 11-48b" /LENGTH=123 /DNA_ID=CAMNT_0049607589 /DNA_START=69 /DNA_END=440 /DNA_ORIENTATION=+
MVVQLARTQLASNSNFHIALRKIFGIGKTTSLQISEACGISKDMKVRDVKEPYIQKVAQYIQDNYLVGDELKRSIRENILQLIDMNSYRGTRHQLGLSLSGKTHSNNSTAKRLRHVKMYDTSK